MNLDRVILVLSCAAACLLGACSAPTRVATALPIPAGRYEQAFDAAREALRDLRFDLERVDARLGVITTRPHATDGLATPWDSDQSSSGQEIEDLVHQQRRRVRITFAPPAPAGAPEAGREAPLQDAPLPSDLVDQRAGLTMRVAVTVSRAERPGWRVGANSVRGSTFAYDPERSAGAEESWYETPVGDDPALAGRILESVRASLKLPIPRKPPAPSRSVRPAGSRETPPPTAR